MDIFRILNVCKYTKRFKEDLKCNKVKKGNQTKTYVQFVISRLRYGAKCGRGTRHVNQTLGGFQEKIKFKLTFKSFCKILGGYFVLENFGDLERSGNPNFIIKVDVI